MSRRPLLLWGLYFLIGCSWPIAFHFATLIPLAMLLYFFPRKKSGIAFLLAGCLLIYFRISGPLPEEELKGTFLFNLQSIDKSQTPFHSSYALKGTCLGRGIPCTLFVNKVPKTGSRWKIEGRLSPSGILKPNSKTVWEEVDAPFSLARFRHTQKKRVARFFRAQIKDKNVSQFLTAMTTGEKPSWLMMMEFRKIGLSHILAISGFHFALIALLISTLLRCFLPIKLASIGLLLLLTLYLLFLGASPSILRAYIMISLFVLGRLLRRRSDPLNLLGAALLIELLLDPTHLTHLGFQLSFLATFGILAFYPIFEKKVRWLLPKRSLKVAKEMPLLDQHGYLLTSGIRSGLALNLAVQVATLPLIFTYFGSFPLLSLPYNLLLPPLLALSLLLLPFALLLPPLKLLHIPYTSWLLNLIGNPPEALHFKIFLPPFPPTLLLLFLTLIVFFGLKKRTPSSENRLFS